MSGFLTDDGKAITGVTKVDSDDGVFAYQVDKGSNVVRPQDRPDDLKRGTPAVVTPTVVTPTVVTQSDDGSSDFHKEMMASAKAKNITQQDKPRARPFVSSRTDMQ